MRAFKTVNSIGLFRVKEGIIAKAPDGTILGTFEYVKDAADFCRPIKKYNIRKKGEDNKFNYLSSRNQKQMIAYLQALSTGSMGTEILRAKCTLFLKEIGYLK